MTFIWTRSTRQDTNDRIADLPKSLRIISMVLLGTMSVIVLARQILRLYVFRRISHDDISIFVASTFAVGVFVTTYLVAQDGLSTIEFSTSPQAPTLMEARYMLELLYIPALYFSKLSLLIFQYTVFVGQRRQQHLVLAFGLLTSLWTTASLLAAAFQCSLPKPWLLMADRCFNTHMFWIIYGVVDMITEVTIFIFAVDLVANLSIRGPQKFAILACFAPRALVVCAALVRITYLATNDPFDSTAMLWIPTAMAVAHVWISVCTGCIPSMVPYLRIMEVEPRKVVSESNSSKSTAPSSWVQKYIQAPICSRWKCAGHSNTQYDRITRNASPEPTYSPLSPGMSCAYLVSDTSISSKHGLGISIPMSAWGESVNTQKRISSESVSPRCSSPPPGLSQMFVATRKAPMPPAKTHTPTPSSSGMYSLVGAPMLPSPPMSGRMALYPPGATSSACPSPYKGQRTRAPSPVAPIRSMQIQGRKFSTTPRTFSPPQTIALQCNGLRPASIQDTSSPMGAAINNYFRKSSSMVSPSSYVGHDMIPLASHSRV